MARGDGIGHTADGVKFLGVHGLDNGLCIETALALHQFVAAGLGAGCHTKGGAVHKAEMRVVKRVFQRPHGAGCPTLVKLENRTKSTVVKLWHVGDVRYGVLQRNPGITITRSAKEGRCLEVNGYRPVWLELGNPDHLAAAVIRPAVVAALQMTLPASLALRTHTPAFGQLGCAVATPIAQGGRAAVGIQEQDDLNPQQGERFGAVFEVGQRHDGMPEFTEDGLLGDQHEALLGWK